MRAGKILLGLGIFALVTAWAENAATTPLRSGADVPQLSGVRADFGASPSSIVVEPVIDVSTEGGLVQPGAFSPLVSQELLRPTPPSGSLEVPSISGTSGFASPAPSSPSIEIFQEIVGGELGAPLVPGFDRRPATEGRASSDGAPPRRPENPADDGQVSLRDLVRLLINQPENLGLEAPVAIPAEAAGPAGPGAGSILSTIMSITVDREIVQAISRVIRPSIDVDGVVALNVFGLREIALLVSPSSNSIRMVELGSGRTISFRYEDRVGTSSVRARHNADLPGASQNQSQRENLLPKVIATIRSWIQTYVLNGVTLISLGSLSVFWIVWRFARSENA